MSAFQTISKIQLGPLVFLGENAGCPILFARC